MTNYRIGWKDRRDGKWKYITVETREEMIEEVADKTLLSDNVSVKVIKKLSLIKR